MVCINHYITNSGREYPEKSHTSHAARTASRFAATRSREVLTHICTCGQLSERCPPRGKQWHAVPLSPTFSMKASDIRDIRRNKSCLMGTFVGNSKFSSMVFCLQDRGMGKLVRKYAKPDAPLVALLFVPPSSLKTSPSLLHVE